MDPQRTNPATASVPDSEALEEQLRIACSDLSSRLRRGEPCQAEEFLANGSWTKDAGLELVYTEFVVRQELGQNPLPQDWQSRFPQWHDDLEELFEVHRFVCQQAEPPADAGDTVAIPTGKDTRREQPTATGPHFRTVTGYEILEEVGRGGMGVVYKARQLSVDRVVALKMILASEHASPDESLRFKNEAQAAASLHHPNIAEVFEAGEQNGCPYLAMEFIEGNSLEVLLAKAPLTSRSAAELLRSLAVAVHYAHQQCIIHRDLKPSNILMTRDGVPKIGDFGLAKRFGAPQDTQMTRTGVVLGTPSYMPPEQALGKTRDVSPAADIYALGAILYEMLTGRPPFVSDSALETLRLVQDHPPVPPRQLDPSLPPDMETICLKCLEKDPHRRYASAQEIADEAKRFLSGEPLRARPLGPTGRLWRWCRRRPLLAGMTTAIAVLLAALAIGGSWFGWRQHVLRTAAVAESKRADESAAEAKAVTDYLVKTFRSPDPWLEGKDVTMATALDNAIASLETDWPEDAAAKAALCEAFARTLGAWGEYDRALDLARRAQVMRTRIAGEDDVNTLRSTTLLADTYLQAGKDAEASRLISDVYRRLRAAPGANELATIQAATVLAKTYQRQGKLQDAIDLLDATYRQAEALYGEYDKETQTVFSRLVVARQEAGEMGQLTDWLQARLDQARGQFDEDNQIILELEGELADSLRMGGEIQQAVELYESSLQRMRRILGDEHPTTLVAMNNLASGYAEAGRLDESTKLMREILPIRQRKLGPDHPQTLGSMHNLAMALYNQHKDQQALEVLRQTLPRREAVLGSQHRETLETRTALGRVLMGLHEWDECLPLLEQNLQAMQKVHGEDHPETLDTAWVLGMAYNQAGKFDQALEVLESARKAMIARFGETNPRTLRCTNSLAITYRELGDLERACELFEIGVRSTEQQLGSEHVNTCTAKLNYGMLLVKISRFDVAEEELRPLIATLEGGSYPEHTLRRAQTALGEVLTHQRQFDAAESLLLEAHDRLSALDATQNPNYLEYLEQARQALARLYEQWGRTAEAEQWRKPAC